MKKLTQKHIKRFLDTVGTFDFKTNKLGGVGKIDQVDETGLNYKVKAHRGRSPVNKTDALCIVEVEEHITRAFACVIENKKAETLIPIITDNVEEYTTIWTDEHKSYQKLSLPNHDHDTVCHKYEFINKETGANTQAVESFNNEVNLEIKRRKGIRTTKTVFFK
jgi:transposase-like protein